MTSIGILIILLLFSAFFSGIEIALMSLDLVKVNVLVKQKKKGAEALYRIKRKPHHLLITILIGNNLVNIGAASLATVVFTDLFGSAGIGVATGTMTLLILIFGEITPKTFAIQNAKRVSLIVARPIEILITFLKPIVLFLDLISNLMSKLLGSKKEKHLSEEEIRTIVSMGREEGILSKEAESMMHKILVFEGTTVAEIMTPKREIHMLDGNKTIKQILPSLIKTHYTRYPVYQKNKNNVIGILDIESLLKYVKEQKLRIKIKKLVRKVPYISAIKHVDSLLIELEGKHIPMAIVLGETGRVLGLVTLEDILEEIVGDIFERSKQKHLCLRRLSKKTLKADSHVTLEEINAVLHLGIPFKHFETLAGFIEKRLKGKPRKGRKIQLKNVQIEITKLSNDKITTLKITKQ